MQAAILPFFNMLLPLAALVFFYKLAAIIQRMYDRQAIEAMDFFYDKTIKLFENLLDESKRDSNNNDQAVC